MKEKIYHKSIKRKHPDIVTRRAVIAKLRRTKDKDRKPTKKPKSENHSVNQNPAITANKVTTRGIMDTDFYDAHNRHWQDANSLFRENRWANADQLFGLSAECGLKKLMLIFGMPFDTDKDMPQSQQDKKHVDGIWERYETYRSGHHQGTHYTLSANNPFHDWHVSQRYANQSNFDQIRAESHRSGANQVRTLIHNAQLDGLI